ncbi:MAG: Gfo/Idh/MocA family oxidoreductase, partial [Chloroflexi bacterium]|nr:Gfo/Idh/MocA family oxidoreductase [Chloroflexota bacterium]
MLRVGLIGAGMMGEFHASGWVQTPAKLVAIHSKSREQAEKLAGKVGADIIDDLDELFRAVDVVDICTPTHRHHEQVLAAAAAGKHIVCEKPLARTPQQAAEMIAACQKAGVKLLVAHVVRFFPEYAQAKEIVMSGEIGQVGVVRLKR